MGKTNIEVSTWNPHSIAGLTLQGENFLIAVNAMTAEHGDWLSGHVTTFQGMTLLRQHSFSYEPHGQVLAKRVLERALRGIDFSRAGLGA